MSNNIKNNDSKKYTIYKIQEHYNIKKNDDDTFDCDTYTSPIDILLQRLQKNKGYHIRINKNDKTILFLDVDKVPDENTFMQLKNLLCIEFDILPEEIKYTKSIKLDNALSYHLSIPKIECVVSELKKEFSLPVYKNFSQYIDLSIYSNKVFKLPNQTNGTKTIQHTIINGTMKDFIIHYVDETDDELSEKEDDITEDKEKIDKLKIL